MLDCCNINYNGFFSYVLFSSKDYYRRIEFGICPVCGCAKFSDCQYFFDGTDKVRRLKGKNAFNKYEFWRKKLLNTKHGFRSNQNVYYGDFKKTHRKDENGQPIYLQLRKNFNDQTEVIGEIRTKVYN